MKNILLGILFFSISIVYAQPNIQLIDQYFDSIEKYDQGFGGIAIMENGQLTYHTNYGYATVEPPYIAKKKTKYRIGSISKTFTAVCIMKAIEEKKLSLSTKLSNFYPDLPNSSLIEIHHLLKHRSGLHNFTDDQDYASYMLLTQSREDHFNRIKEKGVDFTPGGSFSYSNTNYVVLAYILEDLYEESYSKIIDKIICKPLKLRKTYHGDSYKIKKDEALSYIKTFEWFEASKTAGSVTIGAGGIVSTPIELCEFIQGLVEGKVITKESLGLMQDFQDNYGFGLVKYPNDSLNVIGHTGQIDGFQSILFYIKEKDMIIVICANGVGRARNQILKEVRDLYFGSDIFPDFNEKVVVDEEILASYLGTYSNDELKMEISIAYSDGGLVAQAAGQSAFPLDATSDEVFEFRAAGLVMKFDGKGSFILFQGGKEYLFTK
jgi:D-alanyl-D-alanine carboxypeptidase